jgi:hypothetical protein
MVECVAALPTGILRNQVIAKQILLRFVQTQLKLHECCIQLFLGQGGK